jgi:hypothetical protein
MPQLFVRVELRGNPTVEIYQRLHALMQSMNWFQTIAQVPAPDPYPYLSLLGGSRVPPTLSAPLLPSTVALPHATYQGTGYEPLDIPLLARTIKQTIEQQVWTRALVLVVEANRWSQTEG